MKIYTYPAETIMLMQAIMLRKNDVISTPIYKNTIEGNNYVTKKLDDEKHIIPQDIVISDYTLANACSRAEWDLVGRITNDIKINNCLWYCDPKLKNNSSLRKAINGLVAKNILWRTNTTHFYFINPQYIRRGRELEVLYTTGQMIFENNGIDMSLLKDKRAIKDFDFSKGINPQTNQIQYGYSTDENSEH